MIEKGGLLMDQNSEKFQNIYFLTDEMIGELDPLLGQVLWDGCPSGLMAPQISPEADSWRANVT